MPADQVKKDKLLQDLGLKYANEAMNFLATNYSEQLTVRELANFSRAAISTMLGSSYAIVHHNASQKDAEDFLSAIFVVTAAIVRMKGIPVELSIKAQVHDRAILQETPTLSPEAVLPAAAAPPEKAAEAPVCRCTLDAQGVCPSCPASIQSRFTAVFGGMAELFTKTAELNKPLSPCRVCSDAYLDAAIASVIVSGGLKGLTALDPAMVDTLFTMLLEFGSRAGLEGMPLTEAAWEKMVPAAPPPPSSLHPQTKVGEIRPKGR